MEAEEEILARGKGKAEIIAKAPVVPFHRGPTVGRLRHETEAGTGGDAEPGEAGRAEVDGARQLRLRILKVYPDAQRERFGDRKRDRGVDVEGLERGGQRLIAPRPVGRIVGSKAEGHRDRQPERETVRDRIDEVERGDVPIVQKSARVPAKRLAEHVARTRIVEFRGTENGAHIARHRERVIARHQGRISVSRRGIVGLGDAAGIGSAEIDRGLFIDREAVGAGGARREQEPGDARCEEGRAKGGCDGRGGTEHPGRLAR
ncbi:MAG: hypothetical protein HXY25_11405 [Alphaproteobacteria bacterium]|nr:hypothetical protein [Alphaproteobacteria bacterium]